MTYYVLQQQVYQNKLDKGFNITDVQKEVMLCLEEYGELYDASIGQNHDETVDAIGDIMIYCLGLVALFEQNADDVINLSVVLPELKNRLDVYFPFLGREIGLLAKTYRRSNRMEASRIYKKEDILSRVGNIMGYCHFMFKAVGADEIGLLEHIIQNNQKRTSQRRM